MPSKVPQYQISYDHPKPGNASSYYEEPWDVSLYFPRTGATRALTFRPDTLRQAPREARVAIHYQGPFDRLLRSDPRDYYAVAPEWIWLTDACPRGVHAAIDDLERRGALLALTRAAPRRTQGWDLVKLERLPLPAAAELLGQELDSLYPNGGAVIAHFAMPDLSESEKARCNWMLNSPVAALQLLRNPALAMLSVLRQGPPQADAILEGDWMRLDPFQIPGTLASRLYWGGAVGGGFRPDHRRALALANSARESLWGERYDGIFAIESSAQWSPWLGDMVSWTLLVNEISTATVTCFFGSDTE